MKTIAIIPAKDERKYIRDLVNAMHDKVDNVIVSDDYSMNGTKEAVIKAGGIVVSCDVDSQHGYGAALSRGIKVTQLCFNPDILVFMDGDGQHSPDDFENMIEPILKDRADVVLGCRLGIQDRRPLYRRISNKIGTWLINIGASQKIADAITGYWAMRYGCLLDISEKGWGFSFENLMKCRQEGYRIESVEVKAIWHKDVRENSTANSIILGLIVLWKIIKWRFICEVLRK